MFKYHGNSGRAKIFEVVRGDVLVAYRGERFFSQPCGLFGGQPAPRSRAFVQRHDGPTEEIPSKGMYTLHAGNQLHVFVAGGGGYGDPWRRDPQRVLEDVLDRKVSLAEAADLYYARSAGFHGTGTPLFREWQLHRHYQPFSTPAAEGTDCSWPIWTQRS